MFFKLVNYGLQTILHKVAFKLFEPNSMSGICCEMFLLVKSVYFELERTKKPEKWENPVKLYFNHANM